MSIRKLPNKYRTILPEVDNPNILEAVPMLDRSIYARRRAVSIALLASLVLGVTGTGMNKIFNTSASATKIDRPNRISEIRPMSETIPIKPGDTLTSIARRRLDNRGSDQANSANPLKDPLKNEIDGIVAESGLEDPDVIFAGDVVYAPTQISTARAPEK